MTVEHYAVEGRRTPLVLGVLEGTGDRPGVLFDAHYDTVGALPIDWSRDPWDRLRGGRRALRARRVDSKGSMVAMLAAVEPLVASGDSLARADLLHVGLRRRGLFRGAALMADLGVIERVGTVFSAEATSNRTIEIAYPGDRHLEDHGDRAHGAPDRAGEGHQRDREDGPPGARRSRRAGWSCRRATRSGSSRG